jgi:mevalonate kinase
MLKQSLFYSKILLFGEYGIIEDSMGLSIPFNQFMGALKIGGGKDHYSENSNDDIHSFYEYLLTLEQKNELPCAIDLESLKSDLD